MDLIKGTPCEAAIEKAIQLAHLILAEEVAPFDGGRQIAGLGSFDCYDFLNKVDVVVEMAAFWQIVGDAEQRQAAGLPPGPSRAELSEEIRRAARNLIEQFGIKGTPCEAAIEKAMLLARQILAGEVDPFDGGTQIAWLGSADCYDFLNEVDVVDAMGGFWQIVDTLEHRRILALPGQLVEDTLAVRAEISEEIRRAARTLLERFGPKTAS